ncbi:MAG: nucleotidyltransferase family protein [Tissierellia bacterium]|nr:nucleotidyltransferase family protein [Tissierellia bacterium]
MKIIGIIQASGLSKRMGKNKLYLDIRGKPMYQYIVDEALDTKLNQVIVVSNENKILDYADKKGAKSILNEESEKGQSRSIIKALEFAQDFDAYLFMVADQPFLKAETINIMIDRFKNSQKGILLPLYCGMRASPGLFDKKYKSELNKLKGDENGRIVVQKYRDDVEFIEIGDRKQGIDIDTYSDYERYCL